MKVISAAVLLSLAAAAQNPATRPALIRLGSPGKWLHAKHAGRPARKHAAAGHAKITAFGRAPGGTLVPKVGDSRLADACPAQSIGPQDTVQGTLNANSCHLNDLFPDSTLTRPAAAYRVTTTQKGALAMRLQSTQFVSDLLLIDSRAGELAENHNPGGTKDAQITISLNPGTYTIVVTSSPTDKSGNYTGDFKLSLAFESTRNCTVTNLSFGQEIQGTLTDTSCRMLDLNLGSTDTTLVDVYRVTTTKTGVLTVTMNSTDFDAFVSVVDSQGGLQASNKHGGGATNARVLVSLDQDAYTILANTNGPGKGAYKIQANFEDQRACQVHDVKFGATVQATLSDSDCRYLDVFTPDSDATYLKQYRFQIQQQQVITIDMKSPDFDSSLELYDSQLQSLTSDDGSGGNNAGIVVSLDPGTYFIFAGSYEVATGSFTLNVASEDLRKCPVQPLAVEATVTGSLQASGCRFLDFVVPSDDPTVIDIYKVSPARRGVLTVAVSSGAFDTLVVLTDANVSPIADDHDGGGGTTSLLEILLDPDDYLVLVAPYDNKTGDYQLKTSFSDPRNCPVTPIALNSSATGTLASAACRLRDILPESTDDLLVNQFAFDLTGRTSIALDLSSSAFVPSLALFDDQLNLLNTDLHSRGTAAHIAATLGAGHYLAFVTTLGSDTGDYTLKLTASGLNPAPQ